MRIRLESFASFFEGVVARAGMPKGGHSERIGAVRISYEYTEIRGGTKEADELSRHCLTIASVIGYKSVILNLNPV